MHIYLQYVAMFMLGQAIHLLAVKIPSLRKKSATNNHTFSWADWWKEDWNLVLAATGLGTAILVGLDEFMGWHQWIADNIKWTFWAIGFMGNSIGLRASNYEKKIMAFLDLKANFTDAAIGPTRNKSELIEKGTEITGTDITKSPRIYGDHQKEG